MPIVNFYHVEAFMKGSDRHDFIAWVPPVSSLTLPDYEYYVECDHKSGTKIVGTVTSDRKQMIQQGNEVHAIMHRPAMLQIPGHPVKQPANQSSIDKSSFSRAQMAVAGVSGQSTPLACCLENAMGRNINCSTSPVLKNEVKCVNSVRTRPTKLDYYASFLDQFVHVKDLDRFIEDSPGAAPKDVPRKPLSERLKKYYEDAKRELDKYRQLKPKK